MQIPSNPQSSDTHIMAMILKEIMGQMTPVQRAAIQRNLSVEAKRMVDGLVNGPDGFRLNEIAKDAGLTSLL
jgi:hypothetical protein